MNKRRKKNNRRDARDVVYQIALAGISAAIALLFVGLSVIVRFSTIAFYVAASLAIMVPLTKKYYFAGVFAYVASAALGFVIAGDINVVVGFVAYFGPMALITGIMCNLKVKWYIAVPVKIIYINGALALMYFVCKTIMLDASIMDKISYPIIAVVGTVILIAIDFLLQFCFERLKPLMEKVLRPKRGDKESGSDVSPEDEADLPMETEDIFEDIGFSTRFESANKEKKENSAEDLTESENTEINSDFIADSEDFENSEGAETGDLNNRVGAETVGGEQRGGLDVQERKSADEENFIDKNGSES